MSGREPHQLEVVRLGDGPSAWEQLGFRVDRDGPGRDGPGSDGPDRGVVRIGRTDVVLTGGGGGFLGWHLAGVGDIEGLGTDTTADAATGPAGAHPDRPHPNGISGIDHVVVRTGDVARTAAALAAAGLEVRGERRATLGGAAVRQAFLWAGDVIVELVGPGDDEPATQEAPTLFGLALVSGDLDATVGHLGELAGTPRDAVQPGRRIAGLRGGRVGVSIALAVMSPHVS